MNFAGYGRRETYPQTDADAGSRHGPILQLQLRGPRFAPNSKTRTRQMLTDQLPIHSDPQVMGGTTVFVGTRVPVQTLLDSLEAGDPLDEFLEDFPSVSREQVIAVLELAKEMLIARASAV
jgi:uncharacterized protein (DUF433 family)